jgi:hypothetical protein
MIKNQKLYNKVKSDAKKKFKVWPSAYASGWLVKEYKNRGGTYTGKKPSNDTGLKRWFSEKWINVCKLPKIVTCGRPKTNLSSWKKQYPYCRPRIRISSKTPTTSKELTSSQIKSRCKNKQKSIKRRSIKRRSIKRRSIKRRSIKRRSIKRR